AVVVEVEQLRVRPDVGGVEGHEDRHVAEDPDVARRRVRLQPRPLAVEPVLPHPLPRRLRAEALPSVRQGGRVAQPQGPGPAAPASSLRAMNSAKSSSQAASRSWKARKPGSAAPPPARNASAARRSSGSLTR